MNKTNIKVISSIFGAALMIIFAMVANYYIVAWQEPTFAPPGGGPTPTEFPVGMVSAFNLAACPTGWANADGTDGRPDLRGKFVLGAGAGYSLGATGGEVNVTLTNGEMPGHNHGLKASVNSPGGNPNYDTLMQYEPITAPTVWVSTEDAGSGNAHNNMPPYYTLIYCVKL